jgi:ATP-dependent Clp protease ATP-binding subunit ClpX
VPVICSLTELDEAALIDILKRPKNAIIKQFQKLFAFEGVSLTFAEPALKAIAKEALKRKTGARGLRSIIEESMLDLMYEVPSDEQLREVLITADFMAGKADPVKVYSLPKSEEKKVDSKKTDKKKAES